MEFDRINLARFLYTGESLLMDMWLLLTMLNCLRVLVASLLLLFLKVGKRSLSQQQPIFTALHVYTKK